MATVHRINALRRYHTQLKKEIENEYKHAFRDEQHLKRLKVRRLNVKEAITNLEEPTAAQA